MNVVIYLNESLGSFILIFFKLIKTDGNYETENVFLILISLIKHLGYQNNFENKQKRTQYTCIIISRNFEFFFQ